jgi:glycosyltransferase involved in cell wall biosynthesis
MDSQADNKESTPFFSVIIAAYNREELITRALDSLIWQTDKDWEAVIVDDGSTDRTFGTVFPYLKMFRQIKYLRKQHSGGASSKNRGIKEATGKYITFLDSDDEFSPEHLSSRRLILTKNPSIKFLYGGARILGNQFVPDRNNINRRINLKRCVIGGTFIIESSVAREMHGFNTTRFGADADLFDRLRKAGIKMLKASEATYIYHHENEDSVTNRLLAGPLL